MTLPENPYGDITFPVLIRRGLRPENRIKARFVRDEADEYLLTSPRGTQTIFLEWHPLWNTNRERFYYRHMIFEDQFDSPHRSQPIAGGEETALAAGKVVLEIGSAKAIALSQYAKTYNKTTFIGVDQYYEYDEPREIDLTKQGDVQLIQDDWTTLSSIPSKSVDTILCVESVFPHAIHPSRPEESEIVADTVSRIANQEAIWRFNIDPYTYSDLSQRQWLTTLLRSRGWDIAFTYDVRGKLKTTVVAQKVT